MFKLFSYFISDNELSIKFTLFYIKFNLGHNSFAILLFQNLTIYLLELVSSLNYINYKCYFILLIIILYNSYDVVFFIYFIFITFWFFVIKSTSNLSKMGGNQSIVYATPIT